MKAFSIEFRELSLERGKRRGLKKTIPGGKSARKCTFVVPNPLALL
jgi:hypothetical protein